MKCKKYLLIVIVVLILIGIKSMITIKSRRPTRSLDVFTEFLENGNIEELNLRIYMSSVFGVPIRLNRRTPGRPTQAHEYIAVDGYTLSQYLDLFREVNNATLIPVKDNYTIELRFYYVFETEKDGILLEVGMSAFSNSLTVQHVEFGTIAKSYMVINGIVVEDNQIFADLIRPWLDLGN